jgi:RNA recognition motif-containing protein
MSQKIYVGNLNYTTTESSLSSVFAQFGQVESAAIVKDRYTEQSKGFGFVEMTDAEAAQAAINALNGTEIDGRRVRVSIAEDKPRERRPQGGGGGGGYNRYRG